MNIEEKVLNKHLKSDIVIDDILIDAYNSSLRSADNLRKEINKLPEGEIKAQYKKYKNKEYKYYVLVYKNKKKFIKKREFGFINQEVNKRKMLEEELNKYINRINYIKHLLKHYDL